MWFAELDRMMAPALRLRVVPFALVALVASACATPPSPAPTVGPAPPVAAAPAEDTSPHADLAVSPPQGPSSAAISLAPHVDPIFAAPCVIPAHEGQLVRPLVFVHEGRPIARLLGSLRVERMEIGAAPSRAVAAVDDGRVRLEAEVDLAAARIAPGPSTQGTPPWLTLHRASIRSVSAGVAKLRVEWPRSFQPALEVDVSAPCAELRLTAGGDSPSTFGEIVLAEGARAPLSQQPGGTPFGQVEGPPPAPPAPAGVMQTSALPNVRSLEERGAHVKIEVLGDGATVTGWVDKSALSPERFGGLLGMLGPGAARWREQVHCTESVDLHAVSSTSRVRVGTLHAGAEVPGKRHKDGRIEVILDDPLSALFEDQAPKDDVWLAIPADQASRCRLES